MVSIIRRAATSLRWILVGAVVLAAVGIGIATLTLGGSAGHTVSLDRPISEWSLVANPSIDRQEAMNTAAAQVPDGVAVSAEFDTELGVAVWEVEVRTPAGVEYDVTVDANTGKVLGTVDQD
ncbi:PepSY domain-containing protein [Nocardia cyriacigeorgica]|uniref:PepSY domain-containing protein n=1 Tax=Nocardia cyriacigeorgica TaxID=135487 RepID=UPI0024572A79|nr:PepSY domain-containing protein [Nocardia cyriacigeorgica]